MSMEYHVDSCQGNPFSGIRDVLRHIIHIDVDMNHNKEKQAFSNIP